MGFRLGHFSITYDKKKKSLQVHLGYPRGYFESGIKQIALLDKHRPAISFTGLTADRYK